ncbi:AAA family ATPase [Methanobrevibacter sp.]|uniref:AAA family ATPase n=1 Tax=Methanobrevibacter sp. TaxID=66852 RepID=UPI0025EFAE8D|nr:AAA family ATPase [Methanobrevibacter sp.]MBQ2962736.1 AAA family ATPase [Methanobrevibacter sp.]
MSNDLNLEIEDIGAINKANININKINVVGGINSSGKSTVSRLLYCFLKSSYLSKKENVVNLLIDEINSVLKINVSNISNPKKNFIIEDDFSEIIEEYEEYKEQYYVEDEELDYLKKTNEISLRGKFDFIESLRAILELFDFYDENTMFSRIFKELLYNEKLIGFPGTLKIYSSTFESILETKKDMIYFAEGSFGINTTLLPLRDLFNASNIKINFDELNEICLNDINGSLNVSSNAFYIDSFSILNIFNFMNSEVFNDADYDYIGLKEHVSHLITDLYGGENMESIEYDSIFNHVIDKINSLFKGYFQPQFYQGDFKLETENSTYFTVNTSSGIKQLGILQLLLKKEKLKPGSFLIIDEPEVNLHPEWQFRFAEILVLLAKELDITLYINSHSPMFIESIDAFTEYYDMADDINYYLTEESEIEDKYNFIKVESNELYKIYENLGNAYKLVDQLRLKKRLER